MGRKLTRLDVQLAAAYFPVLVKAAIGEEKVTYKDLIFRASFDIGPDAPELQAALKEAIPTNTGRRLETLRRYTSELGAPDLSCLVINSSGKMYAGVEELYDIESERKRVYRYDWKKIPNHILDWGYKKIMESERK